MNDHNPASTVPVDPQRFCVVTVAFGSNYQAKKVVCLLLEERWVASGQIVETQSFYWWENQIRIRKEFVLTCYTATCLYPKIEQLVRANHSYQVCQIVQTPILGSSEPFAAWIESIVKYVD